MRRSDGKQPIGYSIVRVTKDAMTKKGDTLFPSGGTNVIELQRTRLKPGSDRRALI